MSPLTRALGILFIAALAGFACSGDQTPTCMTSVGSCEGKDNCSIDFGTCSDGVSREIKCQAAEQPPLKCQCIEASVHQKEVSLEQEPYKIGLDGAPAVAEKACGWRLK